MLLQPTVTQLLQTQHPPESRPAEEPHANRINCRREWIPGSPDILYG